MTNVTKRKRGRPRNDHMHAAAKSADMSVPVMWAQVSANSARAAFGPECAKLPIKVQSEVGQILDIMGWPNNVWRQSSACVAAVVSEDKDADPRPHLPQEARDWLVQNHADEVLKAAQMWHSMGLGADYTAQQMRNQRMEMHNKAARGVDRFKAASRVAAAIRRESAMCDSSVPEFLDLVRHALNIG